MRTYQRTALLLGASAAAMLLTANVAAAAQPTQPVQAAPAAAGGATDATVAELTVTANRRESTNVLSLAQAVSAFSGSTLQARAIHNVTELAKLDPSLDIQTEGAADERIIIRGISSDVGATTGIYFDETPLIGGFNDTVPGDNIPKLALQDVDHVEVLKGPQGTLFGAGSMDGTLRVVTNQPNLAEFGGWIDLSGASVDGGNGLFQGGGAINLPVVKDTFGVRIAAWGEKGGGYVDQTISGVTRENVNDVVEGGFRVEARWDPNDRLSIVGAANYQHISVDGAQDWNRFIGGLVSPNSPYIGPFQPYNNVEPTQNKFWQNLQLYWLTGRYHFDFGNVITNTSYGYKDELDAGDTSAQDCVFSICQGGPSFPAIFVSHPFFWYVTEDLRFASEFKGPFQIVAGLYWEHDHQVFDGTVVDGDPITGAVPCYTWNDCTEMGLVKPGPPYFVPGPIHNYVQFANSHRQTTDQIAFYTQGDYKILPNLTATFGFRYFYARIEQEEITQQNIAPTVAPYGFDCAYVLGCVTIPYVTSRTDGVEKQPTYNFALLWEATPDVSVYGRIASGFRLGGVNEGSTIAAQAGIAVPATFQPDSLWDYEVGVKAYLFDHKLYFDLTGYHIDWTNEQESAEAQGVFGYTLNVGASSINGVELNSAWKPIPDLTLNGAITFVDAKLAKDLPAEVVESGTPGVKGDRLPFVPRLSISGQGEYDHHFDNDVVGYFQAGFVYHSNSFTAFRPSPACVPGTGGAGQPACKLVPSSFYTELPSYFLLDLVAGARWEKYDASVFVQNATNTAAWLAADANNGGVLVHSPRPLTVGVRINARY